jgi:hypothetical protein
MEDDVNNAQAQQQPPLPHPDLKNLDRLVGTWEMSGDVHGRVTFEWMEGGFFSSSASTSGGPSIGSRHRGHRARKAVRGRTERGDKVAVLQQHGRHPRLRLRAGGGQPHDLGRGEGFSSVRQRHV